MNASMTLTRVKNQAYTDQQYITGLKDGAPDVVNSFFYSLCSYTLNDIRYVLMGGQLDYDDLVSELYIYLAAEGWRRLDTFAGRDGCSLRSWISRLAWRFFLGRREKLLGARAANIDDCYSLCSDCDLELDTQMAVDVESTMNRMPNTRYVQVLEWMLVDGFDANEVASKLDTSAANVYNIKHRAIQQFVDCYAA